MHATRRPWQLIAAMVVVAMAAAGCGGAGGDEASPQKPAVTTVPGVEVERPVTKRTETFTDPSRPTGDKPGRRLVTDVYVPKGDGPFPLIVHAHGYGGDRTKFTALLGAWAARGFVVAAPTFPLTNAALPVAQRQVTDIVQQPADVRFVIDSVLAMADKGGPLAGRIDGDHIGVSGLSLGGGTVYPLLFNPCCRDDRISAMVAMSSVGLVTFDGQASDLSRRVPTLVFAGDADAAVRYEVQRSTWEQLAGPTWLVTVLGGQHSAPYEDLPADPHKQLVIDTTIAFWGWTLRGDDAARARIETAATVPGLARVESRGV